MDVAALRTLAKHATGNYAPVLANVYVYETPHGDRAQVGTGRYWIDVPGGTVPPVTVNAERLVTALAACPGDDVEFGSTEHYLTLRAGKVRVKVPRVAIEYPLARPDPQGPMIPGLVDVLTALQPFVADDASRPWATSVCLSGGYAYATNNVILVRHPLAAPVDKTLNIPGAVIDAVREMGQPVGVGYSDASVTFYYETGAWIRTQLVVGDWPTATVDGMLADHGGDWAVPHPDLARMLDMASRVSDERLPAVVLTTDSLALPDGTFHVDDMGPLPESGAIAARMGAIVFGVADGVQWHTPSENRHLFKAGDLRGIFAGVRVASAR